MTPGTNPTSRGSWARTSRVFINNASIGIYPRHVELREQGEGIGISRLTATLTAAWQVAVSPPTLLVRLTADDVDTSFSTPLVFVGNNAYETALTELGRRPSLSEGELTVVYGAGGHLAPVLAGSVQALVQGVNAAPWIEEVRAGKVTVSTGDDLVDVAMDGEVVRLRPPLLFVSRPAGLRLLVPAGNGAQDPS